MDGYISLHKNSYDVKGSYLFPCSDSCSPLQTGEKNTTGQLYYKPLQYQYQKYLHSFHLLISIVAWLIGQSVHLIVCLFVSSSYVIVVDTEVNSFHQYFRHCHECGTIVFSI